MSLQQVVKIEPEVMDAYTYRVQTTDGTLYVTICDVNDEVFKVALVIGKTGSQVRAWTEALQEVINIVLLSGIPLVRVISATSNITTGKVKIHQPGINIRSGPEGVAYALMKYLQEKGRERDERNKGKERQASLEYGEFDEG